MTILSHYYGMQEVRPLEDIRVMVSNPAVHLPEPYFVNCEIMEVRSSDGARPTRCQASLLDGHARRKPALTAEHTLLFSQHAYRLDAVSVHLWRRPNCPFSHGARVLTLH
jgi:hypothetical protein